jgi:riboflavin transport system permease protein
MLALSVALCAALILLWIGSPTPAEAVRSFFLRPFSNGYYLGNMINVFGLLVLTGLGAAAAFRAGVFNLGGEGQIYAAALAATVAASYLGKTGPEGPVGITIVLVIAAATGGVLAGLSGLFKLLWKTDELITSFLLSAAVMPIVDYLIVGPLNDPASNLLITRRIPETFRLARLFPPSHMNTGIFVAFAGVILGYVFLFRTVTGYEWRVTGLNTEFARYGGINTGAYVLGPMTVSGALHGLAGGLFVLGTHHAALAGFSYGFGWNGLAVALIGRSHPLGVIPAGFVFAYLEAGAKAATLHTAFTIELGATIQAVIFLFITAQIVPSFLKRHRPSGTGRRRRAV